MALVFSARVLSEGTDLDGITPLRRTVLVCAPASSAVQQVLEREGVVVKRQGDELHLAVQDMMTCIRVLEEAGHTVGEYIPASLWQLLSESETRPKLTEDHLRERIGAHTWDKLHLYQRVGVRLLVERRKAYLADEMGTGKTLQACAAIFYFRDLFPALILCPSSLRYTWKAEAIRWLGFEEKDIFVVKAAKNLQKLPPHQLLIVSYGLLSSPQVVLALTNRYQVVIVDEAHYTKNLTSKRSAAVITITKSAQVKFLLSGTPFNYPVELYPQIKALYPQVYPYFFHYSMEPSRVPGRIYFAERYCQPSKIRFRNVENWVYHGYQRSEELNAVLNSFMVRRKKRDVLSQLPPKNRIVITLPPMIPKHQKAMDKLLTAPPEPKKPLLAEGAGPPTTTKTEQKGGGGGDNKFMDAFRLASQTKTPHVVDFVANHLIDDMMKAKPELKTLIFFHHQTMQAALEECLIDKGISFFIIDGSTNPQQRQTYVDEFQKGNRYQIALLSITACGVGLTLTAAGCCVFTEILFGPELHLQAEDRAHRMGLTTDLDIFYLLLPKCTDEINFGLIRKKDRESSAILDGVSVSSISADRFCMPSADSSLTHMLTEQRKRKLEQAPLTANTTTEHRRITVKRKTAPVQS
jgi:SWI/SNF-related matrix-associated actin-dependent regulator 1 of chromatin subfamily A